MKPKRVKKTCENCGDKDCVGNSKMINPPCWVKSKKSKIIWKPIKPEINHEHIFNDGKLIIEEKSINPEPEQIVVEIEHNIFGFQIRGKTTELSKVLKEGISAEFILIKR